MDSRLVLAEMASRTQGPEMPRSSARNDELMPGAIQRRLQSRDQPLGRAKAHLTAAGDTSLAAANDAGKPRCSWCGNLLADHARRDTIFCSRKCRQAAFRIRRRLAIDTAADRPMRFGYADPPYPGMAWMYEDQPSFAGEVNHTELVASLEASYDGFALSTSARALATVLPLFKREFRVCAWVKPIGAWTQTRGIHNTWEPLIVVPGREQRPGKRDWLAAQPARRGGSDLIGRKPEAFCTWMFALLGMLPGDELVDLYPGSGIVGRAWAEVCRRSTSDASALRA